MTSFFLQQLVGYRQVSQPHLDVPAVLFSHFCGWTRFGSVLGHNIVPLAQPGLTMASFPFCAFNTLVTKSLYNDELLLFRFRVREVPEDDVTLRRFSGPWVYILRQRTKL